MRRHIVIVMGFAAMLAGCSATPSEQRAGTGALAGADGGALGRVFRSAWLPQVKRGWFFRAETFFSVARAPIG